MAEGASQYEPRLGNKDASGSEPQLGSEVSSLRLSEIAKEIKAIDAQISDIKGSTLYDKLSLHDEWGGVLASVFALAKKNTWKKREQEIDQLKERQWQLHKQGGEVIATSAGTYNIGNAYVVVDDQAQPHLEIQVSHRVDGVTFNPVITIPEARVKISDRPTVLPNINLARDLSSTITFGSPRSAYFNVINRGRALQTEHSWRPPVSDQLVTVRPTIDDIARKN